MWKVVGRELGCERGDAKDSTSFADGMGGHKPRSSGAFKSLKRQGNRSPLEPPKRSCQLLDLGPARLGSGFLASSTARW